MAAKNDPIHKLSTGYPQADWKRYYAAALTGLCARWLEPWRAHDAIEIAHRAAILADEALIKQREKFREES